MNQRTLLIAALMLTTMFGFAKKVKLTIDGTVSPSQTTLYLIVNEDTANAQVVPVNDARFSVDIKVDRDAFIRLHDSKKWPKSSQFVLIPDSRHITVDSQSGRITGSPMSQRLQAALELVQQASPEGFHIDVFSQDKAAWEEARERERSMRAQMEAQQLKMLLEVINDNRTNNSPAWMVFCFPNLVEPVLPGLTQDSPKWASHPVLKK